ncbi:hypothetical protein QWA68_011843 [Fusarium oxysporum]|nr:hypothetical protein QWA68_011843 [Fusarium oxysporum]
MKRKRRREDKRNRKDGRKTNKKLWGMRVTASNGDGTSNGDHGWGLDCTGLTGRYPYTDWMDTDKPGKPGGEALGLW